MPALWTLDAKGDVILSSRVLAVGTLLWLGLVAISLVWLGSWPRTLIAWLLVLMFGPVLALILEGVGELGGELISRVPGIRRADWAIERRTREKLVSGVRIGYYLARALILGVPFVLIVWWAVGKLSGTTPGAMRAWWEQNFY